jgi:hypothetical protein
MTSGQDFTSTNRTENNDTMKRDIRLEGNHREAVV